MTVNDLAKEFGRVQRGNAGSLWRWGRRLLKWVDSQKKTPRTATCTAIGRAVGLRVRNKPYSRQWVSRAIKVLRSWPRAPRSSQAGVQFLRDFHGNVYRSVSSPAGETKPASADSPKDQSPEKVRASALKCLAAALRKCVLAGVTKPEAEELVSQTFGAVRKPRVA